jgi:diguanylate cyclase (GGDEF)-like protein
MWKFLILNSLWFSILFLVHFFGSRLDQLAVLAMSTAIALWLAARGAMDPVAWVYYASFTLAVFYGARHFRQWSMEQLTRLDSQTKRASEDLEIVQRSLGEKIERTRTLERKSDEIVEFYEKIKDMSKSLDPLETFLVFSEALSEYFHFDTVKLSFFNEKQPDSSHPLECFELRGRDFGKVFDRAAYLSDRKKCSGQTFPFDRKVYETVFRQKRAILLDEPKKGFFESGAPSSQFAAYPVFIQDQILAVVTLVGLVTKGDPLLFVLIERFISELKRVKLYERIQRLAVTDGLTGVYVRHHLIERLEGEMDRSKRFGLKLSFLMIDIDHFKHFNDEYGHLVGDVVLRQVAQTIKKSVREVDFVGRYGGEEFGVGLIETDEGTAFLVAERIRRTIAEKVFDAYEEKLSVNVSIGSATLSRGANTVDTLTEAADGALYQAKRLGRNRVCMAAEV